MVFLRSTQINADGIQIGTGKMNSLILNTHYPPISPFLEVNASQTQFGSVSPFMIMNKEKEEEEPKMNS